MASRWEENKTRLPPWECHFHTRRVVLSQSCIKTLKLKSPDRFFLKMQFSTLWKIILRSWKQLKWFLHLNFNFTFTEKCHKLMLKDRFWWFFKPLKVQIFHLDGLQFLRMRSHEINLQKCNRSESDVVPYLFPSASTSPDVPWWGSSGWSWTPSGRRTWRRWRRRGWRTRRARLGWKGRAGRRLSLQSVRAIFRTPTGPRGHAAANATASGWQ